MKYLLAVDLGTTYTAAAVRAGDTPEVARLGSQRAEIPSLVLVRPDGSPLIGEAAERRGLTEPARLAREFKRRLGDPIPLRIGGSPYPAHAIMARLLTGVVDTVTAQQEEPPERICLTCPANWGPYKRELMEQVGVLAGLSDVRIVTEPEAAAVRYAATDRVEPGSVVAVYDLGGGTFDAAVLRKTDVGFEVLGKPMGIEQLGGMDFDEAIVEHVTEVLGPSLATLDQDDPSVLEGLARLRRDCVDAKEALSYDTEVAIPVALPSVHTRVRLTRSEFDAMIEPALLDTMVVMDLALQSAQVAPEALRSILLAGGSTRIPRISQLLTERYRRPLAMDAHPEYSIALGASLAVGQVGREGRDQPQPVNGVESSDRPDVRPPVDRLVITSDGPEGGSGSSAALAAEPATPVEPEPIPDSSRPRRRHRMALGAVAAVLAVVVVGTTWAITRPDDSGTAGSTAGTTHPDDPGAVTPSTSSGSVAAGASSWVRQADLPVSLEGAAVTGYQDKVWVAGGLSDDTARTKLSTVFIFDPRSNSWTSGPALPRPISHGTLVATPWTLYFIGGWVQDGGSAQVLKLNDTNTAWIEDVSLPAKRVAGAGAFDGTSVIYAGGTEKGGAPTDTVWSLRGGRWQDVGRLAHERQKLAAVGNNVDTVWILGGRDQLTDTKYGDMDRVSQGKVMPLAPDRATPIKPPVDSSAAVQLEGYGVCLVGGEVPDHAYNDWWCEQPGAAAALPRLEPQRAGLGVAKIGDTIYVVGGYGAGFQGTDRVEALTPAAR